MRIYLFQSLLAAASADLNLASWLCNASWGSQPFPTDLAVDVPYDDFFAPDTGKYDFKNSSHGKLTSYSEFI
jgi:hypothetical protein